MLTALILSNIVKMNNLSVWIWIDCPMQYETSCKRLEIDCSKSIGEFIDGILQE